jgi:hypothetical protein
MTHPHGRSIQGKGKSAHRTPALDHLLGPLVEVECSNHSVLTIFFNDLAQL